MAMSVGASRNLILSRRTGGVGDLSETTFDNAELTLEQVIENGIYKVNCTHQVGIATATEVGLAFDRYPIRVILAADAATVPADSCQMCASYWKVCNAAGEAILFARKPLASEIALVALYDRVQGLDDRLWNNYIAMNYTVTAPVATNEVAGITERLYGNLMLPNPTAEQIASITSDVDLLISTYRAAGMAPRFKVAENAYLIGEPHGRTFGAIGALSADTVAAHETLLCAKLNRDRMAARPDNQNLKAGIYTLGGMCVAAMFRSGLFESFEHREFYTVICTPTPNVAGSYTVAAVRSPQGAPPLTSIALSSTHSITGIKVSRTMAELANAMVVGSGLMHYLFNHTTGGQTVSGVLLSTMAMYKFITAQTVNEDQLKITNVIYEALHPSNKRAIANIFFDRSRVVSHGRCVTAPKYSKFELDSFMALRANPHPAGSHKAALCLLGLKRVCQSGLAVFLPWSDQLTNCITVCEDVLKSGARAHIGSAYYTGEPPMVQSSTLDQYLPEIAQYIHTFNKGDSLSMSPHLSAEVARRAAMNWQNLLKDIKAKDVSATAAETVRTYLSAAGGAYLNFNPEDQATWGAATETVRGAMNRIDAVFT